MPRDVSELTDDDRAFLWELDRPFRKSQRDLADLNKEFNQVIKQRDEYARESERWFASFLVAFGLLAISWGIWAVTR